MTAAMLVLEAIFEADLGSPDESGKKAKRRAWLKLGTPACDAA
jgi:hypothetical protein